MRDQPTPHFVGIDIGTSTVRCVIGSLDAHDPSKFGVIGHGQAVNAGMRRGVVVHMDDVAEAITKAIEEAERVSGVRVEHATININGSHILGINSTGVVAISAGNREISIEDRLRAEEAATIVHMPPNREILQVFAKNYRVDGQDNIKDPIGMQGVRLEVDTHIVTAATPNVKSVEAVLERVHVKPSHRTIAGLAAAEAVLERNHTEACTLLLVIGAGTTTLVVVEDGEIQHVGVIPVGSTFLTNDLAIGLKTDLDVAEKVKIEHASLKQDTAKKTVRVTKGKESFVFDAADVTMITEARVEELFEYVDKELRKIHKAQKLPGGVVIVGGMAHLPGIEEFAKEKLALAARIGKLQPFGGLADTVADPAYAGAVGLALLDMLLLPSDNAPGQANDKVFGAVSGAWKKLRRRLNT